MPSRLKLITKDETLREVLGNGRRYTVPKFQRDYSWQNSHCQDLWEDAQLLSNGEGGQDFHYMGYLVLQETETRHFSLIDGQQRLVTFSLLVLAAIKQLKVLSAQEGNSERADGLLQNFIGSKDITYLRVEKKLKLNRNNDYFYRFATEEREIPPRGIKQTVRLMRDALEFFVKKFAQYKDGIEIAKLVENIADQVFFTNIYIGDEISAYQVFETLNARGVKLSSADLLKNYLFSVIDQSGDTPSDILDELDEDWAYIGEQIGDTRYTDYVLNEWNSRHKPVRKSQLFGEIKKEISNIETATQYIQTLRENCQLHAALLNPENNFWKEHSDYVSIKREVYFLRLFGIRQPISMLMAVYHRFPDQFVKVFGWIRVLSMRHNIIGDRRAGAQDQLYNEISVKINANCTVQDIKASLLTLYPNDETFKRDFVEKSLPTKRSNKKACYILARMAEHLQIDSKSIDENQLTVEHILPLNPSEEWKTSFGVEWSQCHQRLGNMALLPPSKNKKIDQDPFEKKRDLLMQSDYQLNKSVENYNAWNAQTVQTRQEQLADIAVQLWHIN